MASDSKPSHKAEGVCVIIGPPGSPDPVFTLNAIPEDDAYIRRPLRAHFNSRAWNAEGVRREQGLNGVCAPKPPQRMIWSLRFRTCAFSSSTRSDFTFVWLSLCPYETGLTHWLPPLTPLVPRGAAVWLSPSRCLGNTCCTKEWRGVVWTWLIKPQQKTPSEMVLVKCEVKSEVV